MTYVTRMIWLRNRNYTVTQSSPISSPAVAVNHRQYSLGPPTGKRPGRVGQSRWLNIISSIVNRMLGRLRPVAPISFAGNVHVRLQGSTLGRWRVGHEPSPIWCSQVCLGCPHGLLYNTTSACVVVCVSKKTHGRVFFDSTFCR